MQLRYLILAATLALAAAKPFGTKGGYDRDSDPLLVQSHVPAHEDINAEHITNQGRKTAQPVRPLSGSQQSGEHVHEDHFSGRYSGPKGFNRPHGGDYGDNIQRPIGGGYAGSTQRPIGGGYGDSVQRPMSGGYVENIHRPTGEFHGERIQRPIGGGYGQNVQRPIRGGYDDSIHRPISGGYGEGIQRPISGNYVDNVNRPIRGGYADASIHSPIGGGYRQVPRTHGIGHNSNFEAAEVGGSVLVNRPQQVGVKGGQHRHFDDTGY